MARRKEGLFDMIGERVKMEMEGLREMLLEMEGSSLRGFSIGDYVLERWVELMEGMI